MFWFESYIKVTKMHQTLHVLLCPLMSKFWCPVSSFENTKNTKCPGHVLDLSWKVSFSTIFWCWWSRQVQLSFFSGKWNQHCFHSAPFSCGKLNQCCFRGALFSSDKWNVCCFHSAPFFSGKWNSHCFFIWQMEAVAFIVCFLSLINQICVAFVLFFSLLTNGHMTHLVI